jgi:hypothetical protein
MADIDFNTFQRYKDELHWQRLTTWVKGQGAQKHLVWKGFRETNGSIQDIPMFFIYVTVDEASGNVGARLSANVRFDPRGSGQKVIDMFPFGSVEDMSDSFITEALSGRYGLREVDFTQTPVGSELSPTVKAIIHQQRLINQKFKTIANIYLRKIETKGRPPKYRVETLTVKMESGKTAYDTPQRVKAAHEDIKEAYKDFSTTVRHFKTVGFEEAEDVPEWANDENWDFELHLPAAAAKGFRDVMQTALDDVTDEDIADLMGVSVYDEDDGLGGIFSANIAELMKEADTSDSWYSGPLPSPEQVEPYIGGPSVDAGQIKSMFPGVDEAIQLVNQFDSSLLSNIAFIYNFSSGGAFGVYLSALDEKIRKEHVKKEMRNAGYQVDDAPDGSFSASHAEKTEDEIRQDMDRYYNDITSKGGTTFGINMNKVMQAAQADANESGMTDPQDLQDIATMHLAATMAHEAVHAKGSHSEGPSEAVEQQVMEWILPKMNERRQQRMQNRGEEEAFSPMVINPGARRHAGWYQGGLTKESQFGAQFTMGSPMLEISPAPWISLFWSAGAGPVESMLNVTRQGQGAFSDHNHVERQMRELDKLKWDNEIDTQDPIEDLLDRSRSPLQAYKGIEELMDERREKPLMVPVKKKVASSEQMTREAYYSDQSKMISNNAFGWMNNLDLPMGERIWTGTDASLDNTAFNWSGTEMSSLNTPSRLPRYNPEYGPAYSKTKDIYYWWRDPGLQVELWDDMIQNRPTSGTPSIASPARRWASDTHMEKIDDAGMSTRIIAIVMAAAYSEMESGIILGTRFVCPKDLTDDIARFFDLDDDIKTYKTEISSSHDAIWAAKDSVPKNSVVLAEKYFMGDDSSAEAKEAFDHICGLSNSRKQTIAHIIDQVSESSMEMDVRGMYIVGGFPRTLAMNESWADIKDLDFSASRPDQCVNIGSLAASELGINNIEIFHRTMTLSWEWMGIKSDFRGNYTPVNVRRLLAEQNIEATPLNMDVYARDFTINMFLYSMDDEKVYDVTGEGMQDIKNKTIRTFFDPNEVIQSNPFAILRAIKYAVRYGFRIDPPLSEAMKKGSHLVTDGDLSQEQLESAYWEILSEGKDIALQMLEEYGLGELIKFEEECYANAN